MNGLFYAAKSFYDLGNSRAPSSYENLKHLKEELLRLKTVERALDKFNKLAKKEKISVHCIVSFNALSDIP